MPTRDLSNKRVLVAVGAANSITNLAAPALSELLALLNISPAIRWDGFDFNASASDQVDDRSLDDDAAAQTRGFPQFGGALPLFYPKKTDTSSILRQAFNLFKQDRASLIIVERVGFKSTNQPFAAGDNINVYRVQVDGFNPDTEGDGGYAYIVNLLPQGDIYPYTIVPAASPASVAITGASTLALTAGNVALRGATYQGNDITNRATWLSSDPTKVTVDHGRIKGVAAGTANVTASFPGGTASTAVAVTVS